MIKHPYHLIEDRLAGWPDNLLTIALLLGALVIVCIALFSKSATLKAVALAYIVLP